MKYSVIIPKSVEKEILSLPNVVIRKVIKEFEKLQGVPRPAGCKKLKGEQGWRVRIGEYRILYDIDDKKKQIVIRKVSHRKDVYRSN